MIYQTDAEFDLLPEPIRWRHVRYEPGAVDFTWEREWRIRCDQLDIAPSIATVVVPNEGWAGRLVADHDLEQDREVEAYATVMDELLAEQYRDPFHWRVTCLA